MKMAPRAHLGSACSSGPPGLLLGLITLISVATCSASLIVYYQEGHLQQVRPFPRACRAGTRARAGVGWLLYNLQLCTALYQPRMSPRR
jgi:hypothetical protein